MKCISDIVNEFKSIAGKPGGIPKCLEFSASSDGDRNTSVKIRGVGSIAIKNGVRTVDSWMIAFIDKLDSCGYKVRNLCIEIDSGPSVAELESFRRRISYLALNNDWKVQLFVAGKAASLYETWEALLKRPPSEVIRPDINDRQDNQDTDGRIEKNFQTWLAGEKRSDNERLCVLGEDFILRKGQNPKVLREFPTGAFLQEVSEKNRILPTYSVDLVTVNRNGELSLIELKINDIKLEVLSQSLDYALFFSCYSDRLPALLSELLGAAVTPQTPMVCYLVNTCFHPRFSTIAQYFAPRSTNVPFTFRQVLLGSSTNIGPKES